MKKMLLCFVFFSSYAFSADIYTNRAHLLGLMTNNESAISIAFTLQYFSPDNKKMTQDTAMEFLGCYLMASEPFIDGNNLYKGYKDNYKPNVGKINSCINFIKNEIKNFRYESEEKGEWKPNPQVLNIFISIFELLKQL